MTLPEIIPVREGSDLLGFVAIDSEVRGMASGGLRMRRDVSGGELALPLYYLATTYFHLRKGDLGEELFRRFLEESPGNPSAASYLGRILMWRKEWEEAEKWLTTARTVLPDDGDLNYWLATTYAAEGKRDEAISAVKRSLETKPNREEARKLLKRLEC